MADTRDLSAEERDRVVAFGALLEIPGLSARRAAYDQFVALVRENGDLRAALKVLGIEPPENEGEDWSVASAARLRRKTGLREAIIAMCEDEAACAARNSTGEADKYWNGYWSAAHNLAHDIAETWPRAASPQPSIESAWVHRLRETATRALVAFDSPTIAEADAVDAVESLRRALAEEDK